MEVGAFKSMSKNTQHSKSRFGQSIIKSKIWVRFPEESFFLNCFSALESSSSSEEILRRSCVLSVMLKTMSCGETDKGPEFTAESGVNTPLPLITVCSMALK